MSGSKILFPKYGKNYEADLSKRLSLAGYEVLEATDAEDFENFYTNLCLSSSGSTTVIVDIDNTACVLSIIRSVYPTVHKPKLILITSLLTWCGETQHRSISDASGDFCSRKPLHCTLKAYGLENTLWNIASDSQEVNNITYFIGTGLLYGGSGWDFESALRQSWEDSCYSCTDPHSRQRFALPLINGCNNVRNNTLAIHFNDFIEGIINLIKDDSHKSPSFHPMVDRIKDVESSSHGCNCNLFNEIPVDMMGNISTSTNVLTEILNDPRILLMSSKIFFTSKLIPALPSSSSSSSTIRIPKNFPSVLNEFTMAHKLTPVKMIFIGGPRCGKTETALLVAKMLDLQYVGLVDSLRWVLDTYVDTPDVDNDKYIRGDVDRGGPGRALVELVIAKIAEGPKKGSFTGGGVSLQSFELSDNFISSIPFLLQRKCISQRLDNCPKCCLKGFIIDVWGTGASLGTPSAFISNMKEIFDLLPSNMSHHLVQKDLGSIILDEMNTSDLIVLEFQIDRKEILQRFSSKFSEGKITKDQLLTIKNFETRLDKYSSRLLETENTYFIDEKSEKKDTANDKCFSHEIIIDFINISRFKLISISQSDQSSIDNIVQLIIEKIIPPLHGPLGWSLPLSIEKLTNIEVIKDFNKITSPPKSPNHRLGSSLSQSQPSLGFEEIGTGIGLGMGIGMEEETESFSKINYGLAGLKEKEKIVLMSNCNELLEYLEVNVTPFLAKGLIGIERTQPEDPIAFLIDVLEKQSAKNRAEAEECALKQFLQVLKEAEAINPFGHK